MEDSYPNCSQRYSGAYVIFASSTNTSVCSVRAPEMDNNATHASSVSAAVGNNIYMLNLTGFTSLQTISYSGFATNPYLHYVFFPASLKTISHKAFYECPNLMGPIDFKNVTSIAAGAFSFSKIDGPVYFGNNVSIGTEAFFQTGVTALIFSENCYLTNVGTRAFRECSKLTGDLDLKMIQRIIYESFYKANFTRLLNTDNLTYIDYHGLSLNAYLSGSLSFPNLSVISQAAFSFLCEVTEINLSCPILTTIHSDAFLACFKLKKIYLTPSIRYIGAYAFFDCASLKRINLTNVTSIGTRAFHKSNIPCGYLQKNPHLSKFNESFPNRSRYECGMLFLRKQFKCENRTLKENYVKPLEWYYYTDDYPYDDDDNHKHDVIYSEDYDISDERKFIRYGVLLAALYEWD